jgi:hypothetical protein
MLEENCAVIRAQLGRGELVPPPPGGWDDAASALQLQRCAARTLRGCCARQRAPPTCAPPGHIT